MVLLEEQARLEVTVPDLILTVLILEVEIPLLIPILEVVTEHILDLIIQPEAPLQQLEVALILEEALAQDEVQVLVLDLLAARHLVAATEEEVINKKIFIL